MMVAGGMIILHLTTQQLYRPQSPRNVSQYNISNYWTTNIVIPIPQGVNGSLIQAVLFENPSKSGRVPKFMGAYLIPANPQKDEESYANPYSTCLAADCKFTGTADEAAWQEACEESGRVDTNLHDWNYQVNELISEQQHLHSSRDLFLSPNRFCRTNPMKRTMLYLLFF